MLRREQPGRVPAGCLFPNEKTLELGAELQVRATPTIYFADGSRVEGSISARRVEEKLASIQSG